MNALFHFLNPADKIRLYLAVLLLIVFWAIACQKQNTDIPPLPVWEDNGSDSATLKINIQTAQGIKIYGQYVNLALSSDSLNKRILVRQTPTNSAGFANFRKLYPRVIYYNCYVIIQASTYYGSGYVRLRPGMVKDTILTVY